MSAALAAALAETDEAGRRRYDDDVARAVIALLCLDLGALIDLPRSLADVLGGFALAAGLKGDEPPAVLVAKTRAHVESKVPPALRAILEAAVREEVAAGGDPSSAARALLGVDDKKAPLQGERPAGTIPASPLARFLTKK